MKKRWVEICKADEAFVSRNQCKPFATKTFSRDSRKSEGWNFVIRSRSPQVFCSIYLQYRCIEKVQFLSFVTVNYHLCTRRKAAMANCWLLRTMIRCAALRLRLFLWLRILGVFPMNSTNVAKPRIMISILWLHTSWNRSKPFMRFTVLEHPFVDFSFRYGSAMSIYSVQTSQPKALG